MVLQHLTIEKVPDKLLLKAFKEIPVKQLEMLLPDGTLKMSTLDKGVISSCVFLAATGVLAKVVTLLASMHLDSGSDISCR